MREFAETDKQKTKTETPVTKSTDTVQRDLSDVNGAQGGMLPEQVTRRIQHKRGSGRSLSARQLQHYSEKFGRDMSDVHIHTDAESDALSRSLNARAFTIGSDVFLSRSVNPDGGGRDQMTMAHELTHVVQQNGRAGFGSLRLGAADTAQEHEAEATAMREFVPNLSASNTVQRGFGSTLLGKIGHNLLDMIGLGDAYDQVNDTKVKKAVEKMDAADKQAFEENEKKIKEMTGNEPGNLKALEEDVKTKKEAFEGAQNASNARYEQVNAGSQNAADKNKAAELSGQDALNKAIDLYNSKMDEYEDLCKKQLEAVRKIDETITEDDMEKYRTSGGEKFITMIRGALGASIMSGFSKQSEREEAKKEGLKAAVEDRRNDKKIKRINVQRKNKQYVRWGGEVFEANSLDDELKPMLEAAYDDVMDEEEMKEWLKEGKLSKDKDTIIGEVIHDQQLMRDVREKAGNKMLGLIKDDRVDELLEAEQFVQILSELRDKHPTYSDDAAEKARLTNANQPVPPELQDRITAAETDKLPEKLQEEANYKGKHVTVDVFIDQTKNALRDLLSDPKNLTGKAPDGTFDELKAPIREVLKQKINTEKADADRTKAQGDQARADRFQQAKDDLVNKAAEKLNALDDVKDMAAFKVSNQRIPDDERKTRLVDGMKGSLEMKPIWDEVEGAVKERALKEHSEKPRYVDKVKDAYLAILKKMADPNNGYEQYSENENATKTKLRNLVFDKLPSDLKGSKKAYPSKGDFGFKALFEPNGLLEAEWNRISGMIQKKVPFKPDDEAEKLAGMISENVYSGKSGINTPNVANLVKKKQKENIIKKIWSRVQDDENLKTKFRTWLFFRKRVIGQFDNLITESMAEDESQDDIVDAVVEALTDLAASKAENKGA